MTRTASPCSISFLVALLVAGVLLSGPISSAHAQPSVSVSVGVSLLGEGFLDYWPVAFNASAVVPVPLTRWLLLEPTLSYRLFPFLGDRDPVTIPENPIHIESGEPLQQLLVGLTLRLQLPSDSAKVVPFLDLFAGHEFERFGRVTEQVGYAATEYVTRPIYSHRWAGTASAGLRMRLSRRFSLEPSYRWHTSGRYDNYGLISLDLLYALQL